MSLLVYFILRNARACYSMHHYSGTITEEMTMDTQVVLFVLGA